MPRIVVLGATGFTGSLTARELVDRGLRPTLAGRSRAALDRLSQELGGDLEVAVADVSRPQTVGALVKRGDVLLSTVGPFLRLGDPAVCAAVDAGAHYLDTTGEAPFIRRVFDHHGPRAERAGCALLPAFGYDYVPGNVAGALALERGGNSVDRLDVGYFFVGDTATGLSGGTKASVARVLMEPGFTVTGGRIVTERCGARLRNYEVRGKRQRAMTLGGSEGLTLPRLNPGLQAVDVHQGGLGALTPLVAQVSRLAAIPGAKALITGLSERVVKGSTGGPDDDSRRKAGTYVVAIATDRRGNEVVRVALEGPNVYDATAALAAWGAEQAAAGQVQGTGALGPVEAFGLEPVLEACRSIGYTEVDATAPAQ